jgi:ATP-dependent Clp protease ATP-binding subunit ClpC
MFERYTEKARRVIFFARYEASRYGSPFITPEHLLLGLLREDKKLFENLLRDLEGSARLEDDVRAQQQRDSARKISASVDLPLDNPAKRVLAYAAEEAERLSDREIGTQHLLLGLLREPVPAAEILQQHGIELNTAREAIGQASESLIESDPHRMVLAGDRYEMPLVEFIDTETKMPIAVVTSSSVPAIGEEVFFFSGLEGSKSHYRVLNVSSKKAS